MIISLLDLGLVKILKLSTIDDIKLNSNIYNYYVIMESLNLIKTIFFKVQFIIVIFLKDKLINFSLFDCNLKKNPF